MKYLVLDIETNGIGSFRPPRQTPIQVSFQWINEDGSVLKKYSNFIKGVKKIQWGGSIGECPWSVDFVNENGVSLLSCIREIKKCLDEETVIAGHNIDFDVGSLMHFKFSKTIFTQPKLCTMKSSVHFCKIAKKGYATKYDGFKWPRLSELAHTLKIKVAEEQFHDSEYDVEITKQCLLKLIDIDVIKDF